MMQLIIRNFRQENVMKELYTQHIHFSVNLLMLYQEV